MGVLELRERLLAVARGEEAADLELAGGRVVDVFTGSVVEADVAVVDGLIASVGPRREAAEVMAAAVTNGAPGPDQPTHADYLMLLNELGNFLLYALEDEPEAVKYLQIAARAGDESAQRTLTRLGHPWRPDRQR